MSTTPPIIWRERIGIPRGVIDDFRIESMFTRTIFVDPRVCRPCEVLPEDRGGEQCHQCNNFSGRFVLYRDQVIDGHGYVMLPFGARNLIAATWPQVKNLTVDDRRPFPRLSWASDWEFEWEPYDYQVQAVDAMLRAKYGVLHSPPRSGKTVMAVMMAIRLGVRVMILAAQSDWLDQFLETFHDATNIQAIEKARGRRLCGIAKNESDLLTLDVCLVTYQTFLKETGRDRLRQVANRFGAVFIDEVHDVGATGYGQVLGSINTRVRIGLSGTPDRKDGRYQLVDLIVGPVKHAVEVPAMTPTVRVTETHVHSAHKTWNGFIKAMSVDKRRNKLLTDLVMWYVDKGHYIVVPLYHIDHVQALTDAINKAAGTTIAKAFTGKLTKKNRKKVLAEARSGGTRVVVGIRRIVQVGLNVPRWSCLIEAMPIANPPKHQQEVARILTVMPDKPNPYVHYLVDNAGFSLGCLRRCISDTHEPLGHIIKPVTQEKLRLLFNGMRRARAADDQDYDDPDTKVSRRADHAPRIAHGSRTMRPLFRKQTLTNE